MPITESDYSLDLMAILASNPELRMDCNDYDFNVTAQFGERISVEKTLTLFARHKGARRPIHLYFHLPLCSYLCHYCNYVKTKYNAKNDTDDLLTRWTNALITESEQYLMLASWLPEARVESVYFGGGTAALLREHHLIKLLNHIKDNYHLTDDCEITLEGNPDNFMGDEASRASSLGINRFSVGIQTLQDEISQLIGRGHNAEMSIRAMERLAATGHPANADLIFGFPIQTVDTVKNDVRTLIEHGAKQVTIYRLRNSDREAKGLGIAKRALWNRPEIFRKVEEKNVFPSLEKTYSMREGITEVLINSGFRPAPSCWWSKQGTYADNIPMVAKNKWQNMDTMLGFGPGAYGWFSGNGPQIIQTHNSTDIAAHLKCIEKSKKIPLSSGVYVTGRQAAAVALGYNFKSYKPISHKRYKQQYGIDLFKDDPYKEVFQVLEQKGFLCKDHDGVNLKSTLAGEAFFEEIVSVYFNNWIGKLILP